MKRLQALPTQILKEMLLQANSKRQCDLILAFIGEEKENVKALLNIFLNEHYRLVQLAARPLGILGAKYPQLIYPYLGSLVATLKKKGIHDAVKRNILRITQNLEVPERYRGELLSICFMLLHDRNEATAIRVFAMTTIYSIGLKENALWQELALIIEEELPFSGPAFTNRGIKLLAKIAKHSKDSN